MLCVRTRAHLQETTAQHFLAWVQICGADAMQVNIAPNYYRNGHFEMHIVGPGACNPRVTLAVESVGRHAHTIAVRTNDDSHSQRHIYDADEEAHAARYDGKELLHAVQSACQRCGVRCTDIDGTGQKILIELVQGARRKHGPGDNTLGRRGAFHQQNCFIQSIAQAKLLWLSTQDQLRPGIVVLARHDAVHASAAHSSRQLLPCSTTSLPTDGTMASSASSTFTLTIVKLCCTLPVAFTMVMNVAFVTYTPATALTRS